jgi:sugar phosphate isomerase/epimerase
LNEELRRRSLDELRAAAATAAMLKVRYFVIHPGTEKDEVLSADEFLRRKELNIAALTEIARRCVDNGMELLLENMLPHKVFGSVSELLSIRDGIGQRRTGICFDTGHAFLGGDILLAVQRLSGYLRMIHAHDNDGIEDDHLPPGRGRIDWPRLVSALKSAGFDGFISMELDGGKNQDPVPVLALAQEARIWFEDLWRRGGAGGNEPEP